MTTIDYAVDLAALGMWAGWQETVREAWPFYARSPIYVNQNIAQEDVDRIVSGFNSPYDAQSMTRDVAHGALAFETSRGQVTRQWVDGNVEIGFLERHLPTLHNLDVLDIGAGYGRLAAMLAPLVRSYVCVDPVAVSVEACRDYTGRYAASVRVLDVDAFVAEMSTLRPSLAINVHSWNECSCTQIAGWLDALDALHVPWLFTVSHGSDTQIYPTWDHDNFKPLLEERYEAVVEESLGLGSAGVAYASPHVLWRRR